MLVLIIMQHKSIAMKLSEKRNDPTKLAVNTKPNQLPEHFTEINNEDRNRSVPSRTKLLADATNRIIAGASQFIKNHLGFLQDAGTRLEQQNQRFREREPNKKGFDFADEIGNFTARTRKFFSRISTEINNQFHLSISKVMDEGLRRPGYRDWETDRKSTRLNSSHITRSRMPSSA